MFEQWKFNLLVRSALGLFNLSEALPAESTYYLLRKCMHEHYRQNGEDLMELTSKHITGCQVQEFDINGHSIRYTKRVF